MNENFSKGIRVVLKNARDEAVRLNSRLVTPEHLLLGIILDKDGQANKMLRSLGCDINEMKTMLEDLTPKSSVKNEVEQIKLSQNTEKILRNTIAESGKSNRKTSNQIDLLLILAKYNEGVVKDVVQFYSIDYEVIRSYIDMDKPAEQKTLNDKQDESKTPTLDLFSRDITALAKNGNLDPIVGRELEIERVAQILSRRKKNNPVLIGEPGVGKTAIVEGLALRIINTVSYTHLRAHET